MKKTSLSIILLAHNEERTIQDDILHYHHTIIKKIPDSELIIAEDGSRDSTRKIIYKLAQRIPLVLSVTAEKRGYATSLRMALKKAQGSYIFYADAGGKHDPHDFWKLYKLRKNADLISGYKLKRKDPWYRLFLAWGLNMSVWFYFGVRVKDIDSGFKLMKKEVKVAILKNPWILRDNISLEIVLRTVLSGATLQEVPITHRARAFGQSRGLPLKKIPGVVMSLLWTYPKLKGSLLLWR